MPPEVRAKRGRKQRPGTLGRVQTRYLILAALGTALVILTASLVWFLPRRLVIETDDGLLLDSTWSVAADPVGVVVFCHPHPLDGGTMRAPLMRGVAGALCDAGLHVLRFDFRGVGESQGTWGGGSGEVLDVDAAVATAAASHPDLPLGLAGWSFGASTSLRWQVEARSDLPWAGIAPGIRSYRGDFASRSGAVGHRRRRLIVLGDRDQFATVEAMTGYAAQPVRSWR